MATSDDNHLDSDDDKYQSYYLEQPISRPDRHSPNEVSICVGARRPYRRVIMAKAGGGQDWLSLALIVVSAAQPDPIIRVTETEMSAFGT